MVAQVHVKYIKVTFKHAIVGSSVLDSFAKF